MTRLEDIKNGASIAGVFPNQTVEAVSVEWIGDQAINLVYRVPSGSVSETTLYRDDEHRLAVEQSVQKMADDIIGNKRNPELRGRFAQALAISYSAKFLLMERLNPLDDFPLHEKEKFPSWLNDRKPSAFGLGENGRIKVMDYAMVDFYHVLNPLNGHH